MLGIIGGTGIYAIDGLSVIREHRVDTPFGVPSAPVLHGRLGVTEVVFLPRHGRSTNCCRTRSTTGPTFTP